MASLVRLDQAKLHLGITVTDRDEDIELKSLQASAIILDYLKRRAHEGQMSAVVRTSSVASPSVITTVSPHGLATGASVFLSGHITSVPAINGLWTIAAAAGSTFTIPVAVTTAGTGGTVSVTWTQATVPLPVQASVLLLLAHLVDHRGDDSGSSFREPSSSVWAAIERLLVRSRDPALA